MKQIIVTFGIFFIVVAIMAYMVVETGPIWIPSETGEITDQFNLHYKEQIIQNRPFEQPALALMTLGFLTSIVGVLSKRDEAKET